MRNPGFPHGRGRPYNTRMLVIISVASLSSGGLEVCVQRPQHHANASRIYHSSEQVRATLLKFGIIEKALDEVLKLLPQLGTGTWDSSRFCGRALLPLPSPSPVPRLELHARISFGRGLQSRCGGVPFT